MLKRTALFAVHQQLGARLVEFGGWEMPLYYSGILDEHLAVRHAAGVFDISHMGEIIVRGSGAERFLNQVLTNDVRKLSPGEGQYTLMCHERGGVIDDLYLYRLGQEEYLLVVNAARIDADWGWLQAQYAQSRVAGAIGLTNASDELGAVAIQGPRVVEFIEACLPEGSIGGMSVPRVSALRKNQIGVFVWNGLSVFVGRTGYTGEDGFEVVAPVGALEALWNQVLAAGRACALQPAGLGARDTLRTEVCYPLYGHELDENTTPLEAGLGFFVALEKGPFVGQTALAEQKAGGVRKKCVAFRMLEKTALPRPGYAVWSPGEQAGPIGRVVSGTQSPCLGVGIGLGYVPAQRSQPGTAIEIEIRGRRHPAVIAAKPLYRRSP